MAVVHCWENCKKCQGPCCSPQVISNLGLTSSLNDTNQDKDASERTHKEDQPQDGATLSSEKTSEEKTRLSIDTASQNTQTSPHVQDRMSFQSHQTFCSDLPSTQDLPENTRSEESAFSSQSFPAAPGIRSSSFEESSQSNVGPDSKCQLAEEHVEMEVNKISSDPMNNLKAESPADDFPPPRPDNELQSVQCALSDSATQPQRTDQNEHKSQPSVNETTKMVLISQTQSSTAGILPPSCDWNTEGPDISSHGELAKAQAENLNQQSSFPLQSSISHTPESTKEETHTLQCITGQSEKQQNPSNRKLFGPYNNEVRVILKKYPYHFFKSFASVYFLLHKHLSNSRKELLQNPKQTISATNNKLNTKTSKHTKKK